MWDEDVEGARICASHAAQLAQWEEEAATWRSTLKREKKVIMTKLS